MKTYQDLQKLELASEQERMDFVRSCIADHKNSDMYQQAEVANEYYEHRNRTIRQFQKLLYTVTGRAVPDNYSANFKMATNHFHRFTLQENQYLLGNGVTWENEQTKDKLGKDFDMRLRDLGKAALIEGVSFGFFNMDHMEVFKFTEFVPIYNEENGALMAGIRFWQVADDKPLRATLYEMDGYTDYMWSDGDPEVLHDKRPYILVIGSSEVDENVIYYGENYPTFPIVPLWGNPEHQSKLVGLREQIDCYDLIKSGFANTVDESSLIYWTLQNAGGMDDVDLAKFVERIKTLHAVTMDDGVSAEPHTMDVPYSSREVLLDRLERDMYKDAMALDVTNIASGATTATQILASYEPLNSLCDDYEYCIKDFLDGILEIAGIQDEEPTFTRSKLVNTQEEVQTIVAAAQFLDSEYVTKKILDTLGDGDQAEEILKRMAADELGRLSEGLEEPNPGETPSEY
jgi:SPP1 family phage portal protein